MAEDKYRNTVNGLESPAREAEAVTPDDATDLTYTTRSVYVGGTGDLTVQMCEGGAVITFRQVPVGVLPIRVDRVLATGTSATDIVALW